MKFGIVTGVSLSDGTRMSWVAQGGVVMRSNRTAEQFAAETGLRELKFWLNLGNSQVDLYNQPIPVINQPTMIRELIYPESIRTKLPQFAPPRPTFENGPELVWIKPPGHKGRGKTKVMTERALCLPEDWDWQRHIEGTEYRVVTVGRRAVQAFRRSGPNDDREYEWTGLLGAPDEVLTVARKAARFHEENGATHPHNHMYAWDVIQEHETGQVFIFEGNTAPGVNQETAQRIVAEITRQLEEERIKV